MSSPVVLLGARRGSEEVTRSQAGLGWGHLEPGEIPGGGSDRRASAVSWCRAAMSSPCVGVAFPTPTAEFPLRLVSSFSSPAPSLCAASFFAFLAFPFVHWLPPRAFPLPSETPRPCPCGCGQDQEDASPALDARFMRAGARALPAACPQLANAAEGQRVSGKLSAERIRAARRDNKTYCC